MTSLFDPAASGARALPIDLLTRVGRGVALLDFSDVDQDGQAATEAQPMVAAVSPEKERVAQVLSMIAAAREEAFTASVQAHALDLEAALHAERERVRVLCADFGRDRQQYFEAAETQVVRLALAVAQRVLAREVQPHGMHLEATVRAALMRVQDTGPTVLRVPQECVAAWQAMFPPEETSQAVEVKGDASLPDGECMLETKLGRIDLGVGAQMAEVKRGFEELMPGGPLHG